MARKTTVMNIDLDGDEEINLIKDVRARSNACYKCGGVGYFQRDCKYDGDKPTDNQQAQGGQSPFDSYDPVVGKWMTNLVATTPITAKAMKNLYTELNRQKDIKSTYRKKYKDLQAAMTTTVPQVTLQKPVIVTGSKANPPILKVASKGQGKGPAGKVKGTKPPNKGRKNVVKPSSSKAFTSTGPSTSPKDKTKDKPKITMAMIQDLAEELQVTEQESLSDGHNSEATQESELEQEDNEITLTEDEEQ